MLKLPNVDSKPPALAISPRKFGGGLSSGALAIRTKNLADCDQFANVVILTCRKYANQVTRPVTCFSKAPRQNLKKLAKRLRLPSVSTTDHPLLVYILAIRV